MKSLKDVTTIVDLLPYIKNTMDRLMTVEVLEDRLLPDSQFKVFSSIHGNWYQHPVPIIMINGAVITTGYVIDYDAGVVTFTSAQGVNDIITVTYFYNPLPDDQLLMLGEFACNTVSCDLYNIGELDPYSFEQPYVHEILSQFMMKALLKLASPTALYYQYSFSGNLVNKGQILQSILSLLGKYEKDYTGCIASRRWTLTPAPRIAGSRGNRQKYRV